MPVKIRRSSRLRYGELTVADSVEFWDTLDLPTIPEQTDDLMYTIQGTDRIDRLAQQFYGDTALWWIIAAVNEMELLPTALTPGVTLRIPSPRYVNQVMFKNAPTR